MKNAGREIEVNAVSTVFGRRNNANLPKNEEVIYKSNEITPEQLSLLERPNFAQYPTEQELSSKDVPSASKDNVGLSDMQEKREETVEQDNKVSDNTLSQKIASAESEVNTTPSEGQKKAGNYKKGHVQIGSFNVTIEQLKGSGWAEHDRFYLEMVLRGFQQSYILLSMTFL